MSGEYETMGREELLFRLRDWQQVGQDRTDEIHKLEATLDSMECGLARLAEEVETLRAVEQAARDILTLERYYGPERDPRGEVMRLTAALHRLDRVRDPNYG